MIQAWQNESVLADACPQVSKLLGFELCHGDLTFRKFFVFVRYCAGQFCWFIRLSLYSFSMKRQSRLSLRRRQCSEVQGIHNDPEISNDESFSLSSNIRTSAKECANVTNHGTVKGPNSVIDVSECNLKHAHDISDDSSSDEKVIVIDDVCDNDFKKSSSMFNWNKTFPNQLYQNIESSSSRKTMPLEAPNKRQKLMNDPPSSIDSSSSDDEFINSNKDDSPKVAIQHTMMIAGIKVNLPVKPYPCQIAVMNSVSTVIV